MRGKSDFDDFYIVDKQQVEQQLANAEDFLRVVSEYLQGRTAE